MIYQERPVPPPLHGIVLRLWYLETEPARRYEKILPLPFTHLIVNLSEPYRLFDRDGGHTLVDGAFISGIQSDYLVIESPPLIRHIGAELTPAGLGAMTAVPPPAITGTVRDAGEVIDGIDDLVADLRTCRVEPAEAVDKLAGLLMRAAGAHRSPDPIVERALEAIHGTPDVAIGDLALAAGVSHRTLIARFRATTGMTPKAYAQLWRFHRFVSTVQAGQDAPDWAALAAGAGFYDQPHVIRAFRRFSGWTPAEYHRRVAEFGPEAASFVPLDEVPAARA